MRNIKEEYSALKKEFLQNFLQLLSSPNTFHEANKINQEIAERTSINIGQKSNFYLILFPGDIPEIIEELSHYLDHKMIEECGTKFVSIKSVREKISTAIQCRMTGIATPDAIRKIAEYNSHLTNMPLNLKICAKTCDVIWRLAGDQSTDFNYYTKRALLLPVYMRAISIYCQDPVNDYTKTAVFVKNALDKVVNIASLKHKIKLPKKEDIPILRLFL